MVVQYWQSAFTIKKGCRELKGYEFIVKMWQEYGTTHVFYQETALVKALRFAVNKGIETVLAHSEFAAGYMADGYARVSGRPGVCVAQAIGGANLAAGLHDAFLGGSPVIALTGRKDPVFRDRNSYQDSDHIKQFSGVTKLSYPVINEAQFKYLLPQAYKEAVAGRPGPINIDLMGFAAEISENWEVGDSFMFETMYGKYPVFRPKAEEEMVERAVAEISAAKRPIIVSGRGSFISEAQAQLLEFAEKADIPVATTCDGKTTFDESHPLWCGVIGGYGMDCANKAVSAADLVIFVGSGTGDQTTMNYSVPPTAARVIQIDCSAPELGRNYPNCLGLFGDAEAVLGQLADAVATLEHKEWNSKVDALKADTFARHQLLWDEKIGAKTGKISPAYLCDQLSKALPDDSILISDTGWAATWSSTMIRMKSSQKYSRASGTLGWGFPASIGAQCGAPDRKVVCITGDGGFYYFLAELETAVRHNIPSVTVLNNNQALSQVIPHITSETNPGNPDQAAKSITFGSVNFAKIAEEFGAYAIRVTDPDDLAPALANAIDSGKHALVEVITDQWTGPRPAVE